MPRPIISPSLLSADYLNLSAEIRAIEAAGAHWLHLDIMDGHFVPNLTFGPELVAQVRRQTALPLDVHLMVENPAQWIEPFATAGADILTIHPEADPHVYRTLGFIRALGKKAGLALNPGTSWQVAEPLLDCVDLILIMTVNPGFGGQQFIASQLEKIRQLAKICPPSVTLEVDGGISDQTAPKALQAGASALVAGNYIFKEGPKSYAKKIAALKGAKPC